MENVMEVLTKITNEIEKLKTYDCLHSKTVWDNGWDSALEQIEEYIMDILNQ